MAVTVFSGIFPVSLGREEQLILDAAAWKMSLFPYLTRAFYKLPLLHSPCFLCPPSRLSCTCSLTLPPQGSSPKCSDRATQDKTPLKGARESRLCNVVVGWRVHDWWIGPESDSWFTQVLLRMHCILLKMSINVFCPCSRDKGACTKYTSVET